MTDEAIGTRWVERDTWSGRRVIEIVDVDADSMAAAVTVENT